MSSSARYGSREAAYRIWRTDELRKIKKRTGKNSINDTSKANRDCVTQLVI